MSTPAEAIPSGSARKVRGLQYLIIGAGFVLVLSGMRTVFLGDTATSRLATVYALTHHGTWYLDRPLSEPPNPFERRTIDKIEIDGRLLSSKPPLLPLAMTGEYVVLRRLFGWSLDRLHDTKRLLQCMTVSLVGFSYVLTLVFFTRILDLFVANPWRRLPPLFALTFATQLPGFATQINNHIPAAGMLAAALYFAVGLSSGKLAPRAWRFVVFGTTGALVCTLDIPMAIFVALAGLDLLWRFPRQALQWSGLGAALPLALHFGIMIAVTGSPLPVQVHPELYLYEASYWREPGGLDALHEPKLTYLFHMTFGRHGAFALFPVLLAGLAGAARALVRKDTLLRVQVLGAALALSILTTYYVLRTNNYGGSAYGFRWYIAAMPVLLLMGLPVFERLRKRWHWVFFSAMLAISLYSSWECFRQPWGESHEWTCRLLFGRDY